jgi:PAS domain S-box-containing protein
VTSLGPTWLAERVLVLMPTTLDGERTALLLREAGLPHSTCADLTALCREARLGAGAMVLTDEIIFADSSGRLAELMREQQAWSALPIIVIAHEGASERVQRAAADTLTGLVVVERPVRTRALVSLLQSSLRARRNQYQIRDAIALHEAQATQLRAQEERLRFALAAGGLGSWELDLATMQLSCSEACSAHFGQTVSHFSHEALLGSIHPDDRERIARAISSSIESGSSYDVEYRVCWPNGEVRWLMVRGRATYDARGAATRMAGVSLDISERKQMHDALQVSQSELAKQAEQLRSADQRKDEFLAMLAHELRNPLAPIRTGMELLRQSRNPETAERALGVMNRQVAHMVRLIDDLLDVSRITRGKLELKRGPVQLGTLVSTAVEASKPFIERGQHTLRVAIENEALWLDADVTRVAQVIGNLLNNAAKYTPRGGIIELTAGRQADQVVIAVRDNGLGIPRERLADIFEMFNQLSHPSERAQGGLGIGLALVKRLVELHGGSVLADSPGPGQGSTFTVHLPLSVPTAGAHAADGQAAGYNGARKRVLVVDDNDDACQLLAMMLQNADCQTQTANDGPSALQAASSWSPDIVILDIGMPGMSGYEVARRLRDGQNGSPVRLIALTGWGTVEDRRKAFDAGFDVHLTKPVEVAELYRAIANDVRSLGAASLPA